MKEILLRALLVFGLVLFELSFVDVLFPEIGVPVVPIVAVVAWTLLLGFPRNLPLTLGMALLFDCLNNGVPTIFSLYVTFLSYTISFLSRRLHMESGHSATFLSCLLVVFSACAYQIILWIGFTLRSSLPGIDWLFPAISFTFWQLVLTGALSLASFFFLSPLLRKSERFLSESREQAFLRVR